MPKADRELFWWSLLAFPVTMAGCIVWAANGGYVYMVGAVMMLVVGALLVGLLIAVFKYATVPSARANMRVPLFVNVGYLVVIIVWTIASTQLIARRTMEQKEERKREATRGQR